MTSPARSLVGGASRALAARGLGVAFSFGVGVAVTRMLGPAGAGLYFLAVTLATIAAVVGRLGLDQLLVRRAAAARAHGDLAHVRALGRLGPRVALAASAATAVALWLAAPALEAYAFRMDGLAAVLRTIALGVLPLALLTVYGELLRGLSRTGTSQLVQIAAPPAWTLALLAPAVALAGREPRAAAAAYVGGAACAAAGAAWSWRRAMRATPAADPDARPRHRSEDGRTARELARAALPFLGVSLLTLALSWISMLALALRGDEAEVGVFAVAYRTATLTSFVLVAVNAAAAPRFAALVARGDRAALARIARRTVVATAGGALPLVLVAWIAPGWVLSLFGSEFAAHGRVLAILATGQLVNVLTGSVGALLMMSGHERALRRNLVGATALSLVLHAWLVPSRGPEGAAIASAVAVAVLNVASLAEVRRRLAIDVLPMPFLPAPSPETTRGANG